MGRMQLIAKLVLDARVAEVPSAKMISIATQLLFRPVVELAPGS